MARTLSTAATTAVPASIAAGDEGQPRQPPFLMWYDDNPKTPVSQKIAAAIHAYQARFPGVKPTLILVNEAEIATVEGITVRGVATVSRHTYWVGQLESRR